MSLWLIFDLTIVAIFIFRTYTAMKKGFIRSSGAILSIMITFSVMLVFQDSLCTYIKESPAGSAINENVHTLISEKFNGKDTSDISSEALNDNTGLPKFITKLLPDGKKKIEEAKNDIIDAAVENVTASIVNILSVILLFFAVRIILSILLKLINAVFKLPVLSSVNKLLGFAVGIINSLLIIYILCAVLVLFIPSDNSELIKDAIAHTYITKFFYNDNLILKLFM